MTVFRSAAACRDNYDPSGPTRRMINALANCSRAKLQPEVGPAQWKLNNRAGYNYLKFVFSYASGPQLIKLANSSTNSHSKPARFVQAQLMISLILGRNASHFGSIVSWLMPTPPQTLLARTGSHVIRRNSHARHSPTSEFSMRQTVLSIKSIVDSIYTESGPLRSGSLINGSAWLLFPFPAEDLVNYI